MTKGILFSTLALSFMALSFIGCSNDDVASGKPLPQGTEFEFGAAVEANQSRTYYDPTDVANPNATYWKIFWNYEKPLDHVYIYSPQAMNGRNQASYTVHGTKDQHEAPATKDGDIGIQLSNAPSYNFYGMYPAQAVTEGSGTSTSLSAFMPITQIASTTETMSLTTPVTHLQTNADMNCALMIAKEKGYTPSTDNQAKVGLQFEPFATMLDVTVNGTTGSNTQNTVRITSVIIEANAPIAGDFTYDYESGALTLGQNTSNSIVINTKFKDKDGNEVGVTMGSNSILNVRAFLIPNPAITELKVKVVTAAAQTMTKTLKMDKFKNSQIHFPKLPKIDVDDLQFDYTIWLSQLDPKIYISEISMPGTALSFNYLASDATKKTQTLNLTEQFNKGVRVFQSHINLGDDPSITNENGPIGLATSEGNSIKKADGTSWTLEDVIEALHKEMSGIHKDEFCVLAISEWIKDLNVNKLSTLYKRLNNLLKKDGTVGLVATGITPNTTINDVKGKVIIKVQLNGSESSYSGAWPSLAGANVWANIYRYAAESSPFYSPMPYGSLPATNAGSAQSSSLSSTGMNLIYSECANVITSVSSSGATYRTGVKANATAVLDAYANNYNSDEHRNFSITYLGGCGLSGYYPYNIAQDLNTIWLSYAQKPAKKPWGWVMLNWVGDDTKAPTSTKCIREVIEHNANPNFRLKRNTN